MPCLRIPERCATACGVECGSPCLLFAVQGPCLLVVEVQIDG